MFAKYVSEETVIEAGFNYWETSYCFEEGNKFCRVYHTYLGGNNIVIIEAQRKSRDGRTRRDWHFCTFEGKDFLEQNQENAQRNFRTTLQRKHRITCRGLEAAIQRVVGLSKNKLKLYKISF